jgi:hypothetical protein
MGLRQPLALSKLAHKTFETYATRDLHLALVQLPLTWFGVEHA